MIIKYIGTGTAKWCFAGLMMLCLCIAAPAAWAAYEVSQSDIKANVSTTVPTKWTLDLQVEWKQPSIGATDALNGYLYKWNNSAASLNAQDALYTSFVVSMDGTVDPNLSPPNVKKPAADLAQSDSDTVLYLHIITWYRTATEVRVSADVVYGPFLIDNVAPVGTVRIVDGNGNDVTSTSNAQLNLKLAAAKDPVTMYLGETSTKPSTGASFGTDVVWNLVDTTPGTKTIYAWFEDGVGNLSQVATDSVTLLASTTISPNTATLDLAGVATQVFRVEGTNATYDWSIINEKLETGGAATAGTIAQFSGTSSGTNSVTAQGKAKGTFQLQAVPTSGSGTLTSGTITVVQSTVSKEFDLITTATTSTNTIGFIFENTGITTAHELGVAVGSCTQVAKWNAQTQSYLSHRMQFPTLNNFTLNVGEAYFVTVTDAHKFTLTGIVPASHTQTLITTATTNTNAIGVPTSKSSITLAHDLGLSIGNCSQVSKWNAQTQSYLSHRMQFPTLNNFAVAWGEGYFVTVTQETNWPW
jgi:hypothetical protein